MLEGSSPIGRPLQVPSWPTSTRAPVRHHGERQGVSFALSWPAPACQEAVTPVEPLGFRTRAGRLLQNAENGWSLTLCHLLPIILDQFFFPFFFFFLFQLDGCSACGPAVDSSFPTVDCCWRVGAEGNQQPADPSRTWMEWNGNSALASQRAPPGRAPRSLFVEWIVDRVHAPLSVLPPFRPARSVGPCRVRCRRVPSCSCMGCRGLSTLSTRRLQAREPPPRASQ